MNTWKLLIGVVSCSFVGAIMAIGTEAPQAGALVGGIVGTFVAYCWGEIKYHNTKEGQQQEKLMDEEQEKFENTEWIKKD